LRHDAAVPPAPPLAEASRQSQLIGSLRQDNQRLSAEIAGLNTALERLKTTNSELAAQRTASSQPAPATRGLSIGLPLYELQRTVMNNLRQIDAARKQYQIDKGRLADSIGDLVGVRRYIKTVRTVGGEDYSSLSMLPGQPLTVTTPDGVSVTFDPAGTMTTKVEVPAAVARMQELGNRVQPSFMKAIDAFHAANNGNNPPSEEAVLPYFATPQEGADYVEFMEARKAAGQ
jgi:hypothetical protein